MTTVRLLSSQDVAWSFIDCQHRVGEELAVATSVAGGSPGGWWQATVPGMATQDLIRHGRIPDPFYGDNRKQAMWIEERDVVYRTTITLTADEAAKPCRLVCVSLDTFAVIVLNGAVVARHENQFRRLFVDLTGKLRAGLNHIAIAFEASYPGTVRRAGPRLPFWNEPWERLYVRKSQMSFGWDWAARTPTVGIVDPIYLEFADGPWVGDLHLQGRPSGANAGTIHASIDLTATGSATGALTAELVLDGAVVATQAVAASAGTVAFEHRLAEARWWWPAELGEPHLYHVEIRLSRGGSVIHRSQGRCGIRDVRLVLEDPASPNGKVFYLAVNGKRLWAKGDNWLPIDFLHTRVTREQYLSYLSLLMAGGVNCIRIWGGGIVEHADFYQLCDELGLLIWHDFGFACGVYPNDQAFLDEVEKEIDDIVLRLRSHPSIALWCGNNENEPLVLAYGGTEAQRFHPLYYQVMPKVLARLDPERPYHPGSPSSPSGKGVHPDSPNEGDRHNWDVWFGWKNTDVITDDARFNSEFGAQSFPQRESLESFINPDELWTQGAVSHPNGPSPGFLFARHGAQFDKLIARAAFFGKINSLDAVIATTQAFHADTIGRYVRHYRRLLPVTGGVVLWNYTATWPSICWAAVDWYRRPKQAFYECKRGFRPAVVGIEPDDAEQQAYTAYASVDRPGMRVNGEVVLELREIATGAVVARAVARVSITGPSASAAARLSVPAGCDRRRHAVVATWTHDGQSESDIRYLVPIVDVVGTGGELTITRHADRIEVVCTGWRMRVGVEGYETPSIWDDDYFDMTHGQTRVLRIEHGRMPEHLWAVADMGTRKPLPLGTTKL
ncbi:MAG: hypothetical protein H0W83_11795 [Planctomycetes bacterium]|nr:hypothetical protein [Planctomycetota bacterium]